MRSALEGETSRLDAQLRRVGEWLLVGYTIAMVLVAFVLPEPHERGTDAPSDAVIQLFVG